MKLPVGFRWAFVATLVPAAADASFGGGGSGCKDFVCQFLTIGVVLGTIGVPISISIFAVLNAIFCHEERSRTKAFLHGAVIGAVAFEVAAACAAFMAYWGQSSIGHHENYPLIGFALPYGVMVIASVLHARSEPG